MVKNFAVWHNDKPSFMDNSDKTLANFPEGFTFVAHVDTTEVGAVFQLTNHIYSDWTENPEVSMVVKGPVRSTSVGDVVTDGQGGYWSVQGIGLRKFAPEDLTEEDGEAYYEQFRR